MDDRARRCRAHAEVDELTAVFSALADPTRRSILMRLMAGDASVAELAEPFAMSQPAVSKHLKVLESAGLISRSRVATSRYSHLEAQPLKEANEWMQKYKTVLERELRPPGRGPRRVHETGRREQ